MKYLLLLLLLTGCSSETWYAHFSKADKYYEIMPLYVNEKDKCVSSAFEAMTFGYGKQIREALKYEYPKYMRCNGSFGNDCVEYKVCSEKEK